VTIPLADAPVTATMTKWMVVEAFGEECLFGFAAEHPNTGGQSYVLSTPVLELTASADRARTASGRVYALGRAINFRELDDEGRVALRLLLADGQHEYPGDSDDLAWVTAQKIARHLRVSAPPRADPVAVERFLERHMAAYLALRTQ
jgi:hypothetical protein